jgi:hypothetical protein
LIRKANKFDVPILAEFMRHYAAESPVEILNKTEHHDDSYVAGLLNNIIAGRGFIIVDEFPYNTIINKLDISPRQ